MPAVPSGCLLDRVLDVHLERLAVAEVRADRLRHERERDDDFVRSRAGAAGRGCAPCRACRRSAPSASAGWRSEAGAVCPPRRHHDGLHRRTSRIALATYCPAATTANPRLTQNSASGHQVSRAVTRTRAERRVQAPRRDLPETGDLELVAARDDELVAPYEEQVAEAGSRGRSTAGGRRRPGGRRRRRSSAGPRAGRRPCRSRTRRASGGRASRRAGR